MNKNGQWTSIELTSWILVVLAILLTSLFWIGFQTNEAKNRLTFLELEKNAVMVADSLVKNHSPSEPFLGVARKDTEKKRVQSNQLDSQLLSSFSNSNDSVVFVQKLELIFENSRQTIFEENHGTNCLSVERLVQVQNQKILVHVTICHD